MNRAVLVAAVLGVAGCTCGQPAADSGDDAGIPAPQCSADADCKTGSACVSGKCAFACAEGASCGHAPPAPACLDVSTLRATTAGRCHAGACLFGTADTPCANGCASGKCQACAPSCGTRECGDDGCGGACGGCPAGQWCGGGGTAGRCGGAGAIPPYPGTMPVQLDTGAALGLRVAPDERHVLVQRTEVTSGAGAFSEGALAVVTLDASGAGTARELTGAVYFVNGFPQAGFTADSAALYYLDVSHAPMQLVVAAADGSGARAVASGGMHVYPAGNTLVYVVSDATGASETAWAIDLPAGAPVKLSTAATSYPLALPNATGAAALVGDDQGGGEALVVTATGVAAAVNSGHAITGWRWSPDGGHLAYWIQTGGLGWELHAALADGSGDVKLTMHSMTYPAFPPDGHALAWGEPDATGKLANIAVRNLSSGAQDVHDAGTARSWQTLAFSDDGQLLTLVSSDFTVLAAAPSAGSGAFVELDAKMNPSGLDAYPPPYALTPSHDYAAIVESSRAISVTPTAGGAAHTLALPSDELPFYEPVATRPRLLVFTSTTPTEMGIAGAVAIFATDGAGAATPLPGAVLPAFVNWQVTHTPAGFWTGNDGGGGQIEEPFTWGWLGSEIVYETNRGQNGTPAFDVIAATDDGGTIGVLAPGAATWTVRDAPTPTRVFFTRPQGGVWSVALPQTPGR